MPEAVKYEVVDDHIALVTINRPEARNSVNADVANSLESIVDRTNNDPRIRACILTGEGDKAFSAGADLKTVRAGGVKTIRTERGGFAGLSSPTGARYGSPLSTASPLGADSRWCSLAIWLSPIPPLNSGSRKSSEA